MSTVTVDCAIGIANSTEPLNLAGGLGNDANGLGFYCVSPDQASYLNGSQLGALGSSSSTNGAIISIAIDITNKLSWVTTAAMRAASKTWNNSATANPATGTGGNSLSAMGAGPYFVIFNDDTGGAVCVANFSGAFDQTIPTGFSAWDVGTSVTLTGIVAAGSAGSLKPNPTATPALSVASTGLSGTLRVSVSVTISGTSALGVAGTAALAPSPTGVVASGVVGGNFLLVAALGVLGGDPLGSLGDAVLSLGTQGNTSATASLTGVVAAGAVSNVSLFESNNPSINGSSATGSAGAFTTVVTPNALTGSAAIGTAGAILTSSIGTGLASGTAGNLSVASSVMLTGVIATATASGAIANPQTKAITGVVAVGNTGTLTTSVIITAATSNIHYNLTPWATAQGYSIGNRISSDGSPVKAYQCTVAGTSGGSSPSGTGSAISDGSVTWKYLSAIDFTSVQAWANGIPPSPATLSVPYVGFLWNNGPITTTAGTAYLSLTSHNTSSTNTITLTCAPGESFRDTLANNTTAFRFNSSNGVNFVLPNSTGGINYFDITDAYVVFDGLQFQDPDSSSNSTIIQSESASTSFTIRNCIVDGYGQGGGAYMIGTSGATSLIENSLIVDRQAAPGAGFTIKTSGAGFGVVNCTIAAINAINNAGITGAIFSVASSGTAFVRNTAVLGYVAGSSIGASPQTINVDHCCLSGTGLANNGVDNGNNLFGKSAANQFISATTDFRTTYASDFLDAGVTDTTDLPASNDIAKHPRPLGSAWDIGAWELTPFVGASAIGLTGMLTTVSSISASITLTGVPSAGAAGQPMVMISAVRGGASSNGSAGLFGISSTAAINGTSVSGLSGQPVAQVASASGNAGSAGSAGILYLTGTATLGSDQANGLASLVVTAVQPIPLGANAGGFTGSLGGTAPATPQGVVAAGLAAGAIPNVSALIGLTPAATGNAGLLSSGPAAVPLGCSATGNGGTTSDTIQITVAGTSAAGLTEQVSVTTPSGVTIGSGVVGTGLAASETTQVLTAPLLGVSAASLNGLLTGSPSAMINGTSSIGLAQVLQISIIPLTQGSNFVPASGVLGADPLGSLGDTLSLLTLAASSTGSAGILTTTSTQNALTGVNATASSGAISPAISSQISGKSAVGFTGSITTSSVIAQIAANIHFGLPAWVTGHAYSLGNRVSNGSGNGSAYQCIGAGTSSIGPSGGGMSIPDGTATWQFLSTIDFTSVQAWANAIPPSPTALTNPYVGYLWNDTPITTTAGTAYLNLNGHTTSAINTITLTCAPGESFRDTLANNSTAFAFNSNNGVSFVLPSGTGGINYFDVTDANVIFDGLQFKDPNSTSNSTIIQGETGSAPFSIRNCIIDGFGQSSATIVDNFDVMENCLVIDRQAATGAGFTLTSNRATLAVVNCTIIATNTLTNTGSTGAIFYIGSGTAYVRNTAVFGWSGTCSIGATPNHITADHCCLSGSSLATNAIDGGNNLFSKSATNQFISATADFRTTYASDFLDAGVADPTDVPTNDDIARRSRPQGFTWDIGAWEMQPLAATNVVAAGLAGSLITTSGGSVLLTGPSGIGFAGTFYLIVNIVPIGIVASGQSKSLSDSFSRVIIGKAAAATCGNLTSTLSVSLLGVSTSGATGPIIELDLFAFPLGIIGAGVGGSLSAVGGSFASVGSGVGTGLAGILSTSLIPGTITGTQAGTGSGFAQPQVGAIVTGAVASGLATTMTLAEAVGPLGGVAAGQAGPSASNVLVSLSGTSTAGLAGLLILGRLFNGTASAGQSGTSIGQISVVATGVSASGLAGLETTQVAVTLGGTVSAGLAGSVVAQPGVGLIGAMSTGLNGSIGSITLNVFLIGTISSGIGAPVGIQKTSSGNQDILGVPAGGVAGQPSTLITNFGFIGIFATGAATKGISTAGGQPFGVVASVNAGVFGFAQSITLVGTLGSSGIGVLGSADSSTIAGRVAGTNAGAFSFQQLVAVTGVIASVNTGGVVAQVSRALLGVSAGSGIGTLTEAEFVSIISATAGAGIGSLISQISQGITGITAAGGFAAVTLATSVTLLGRSAGGLTGKLTPTIVTSSLTGVVSGTGFGSVVLQIAATPIGVSASGSGTLSPLLNLVPVNGVVAQGSSGLAIPQPIFLGHITGVATQSGCGIVALQLFNQVFGVIALGSPSFRRASIASYTDSAGILRFAAIDEPRIDHIPNAPFTSLGLLLEGASTNLVPHSDLVSGWSTRNGATLVLGYSSPDGGANASLVQTASGTNIYDAYYQWGGSPNTVYTHSVFAKAAGFDFLHMQTWDFGTGTVGGIEAWFDLGSGLVVSSAASGAQATGVSASITVAPDGFYRCVLTGMPATNPNIALQSVLRVSITGADNSITGDGVSGILVWGDQIEASSTVSSYIPTTSGPATRTADSAVPNLSADMVQPSLIGASAGTGAGSLKPQDGGLITGTVAATNAGTTRVALAATTIGGVTSGLSGSLSTSEQFLALSGVIATTSLGSLSGQDASIVNGAISAGLTGIFSKAIAITVGGSVAAAIAGSFIAAPSAVVSGSTTAGLSGAFSISTQAQMVGAISAVLAGQPMVSISTSVSAGVVAGGSAGTLTRASSPSITGSTASGLGGSCATLLTVNTVNGVIGASSIGVLTEAIASPALIGAIAAGSSGSCKVASAAAPSGCSGSGLAGATSDTITASLFGIASSVFAGNFVAQVMPNIVGASSAGLTGNLQQLATATVAGASASTAANSLGFQQFVYPSGATCSGTATSLRGQTGPAVNGVLASGQSGAIASYQIVAFPLGQQGAGNAGPIVAQIVIIISGQAASGSGGSVRAAPGAVLVGGVASGRSGTMAVSRSFTLPSASAHGLASVPTAQPAVIPIGASATARSGSLLLTLSAVPRGVTASGIAGITRGWLVIISGYSVQPLPLANALVTISAVMDEEPMEMDVFAIPQVIQLVYPVQGNVVGVYSIPQLVNTVCNDG